jgi:Ser/Thr protein kinase RdoA (MazF antagonist)
VKNILLKYNLIEENVFIELITKGLINTTWKIEDDGQQYILQCINDYVFREPYKIAENIRMIGAYLSKADAASLFPSPIKTKDGTDLVYDEKKRWFRLFPFIHGSHTIETATCPEQAFEAAFKFGEFTKLLSGFDTSQLNITIPDFHNLSLRYHQFKEAVNKGNPQRIIQSKQLAEEITKRSYIVQQFEKIVSNNLIKTRVTHHDTKISNVLFDGFDKALCVIDLDTVMPGYFISDLGDMMRTYLSLAGEEEKDFNKIKIRDDYFRAIISGYASAMGDELTDKERPFIIFSGLFQTYMQAMRFLTDHLNNDIYYGAVYKDQNFVRAGNQIQLLKKLEQKEKVFKQIIDNLLP